MRRILTNVIVGGCLLLVISLLPGMIHVRAQDIPTPTFDATIFQPTVETGLPPITTATRTPSPTITPTFTATATATLTFSPTPTSSLTNTPTSTVTASLTPTVPTTTPTPTMSSTLTATSSTTSTATITPTTTTTSTFTLTATPSPTPTQTVTGSPTSSPTSTISPTVTQTPTLTFTPTATLTKTHTTTPTETLTPTESLTPTATETRPPPIVRSTQTTADSDNSGSTSPLLLAGGIIATLAVGVYMLSYATSVAALERYADGFVIQHCPVCYDGELSLEERIYRLMGIPRVRRTVRCDNCRSVLREVGKQRWRYAVDPTANDDLYHALNNRTVREGQLLAIAPDDDFDSPQYVDEA